MNAASDRSFANDSAYRRLAHSLDALPNRFPAAEDESDLRLLSSKPHTGFLWRMCR